MTKPLFIILGFISLAAGVIGIFLPIWPTTPFLLLTAYFFSKGSERLYRQLLSLPKVGESIYEWNKYGVIPNHIKIIAVVSITAVIYSIIFVLNIPRWRQIPACIVLVIVIIFILSRPSRKANSGS